jgi:transcriptional regulator with XRE-family HTH domain
MKELAEIVGANLAELRKAHHLSQQELAEKIGYSDKSISKWELGKAIPSVDILKKFADYYGTTVDELLKEGSAAAIASKDQSAKNNNHKIIITNMAACAVVLTAAAIYIDYRIVNGEDTDYMWTIFLWMVPAALLVCGILSFFFWGRTKGFWVLCSVFVWTVIASLCITFFFKFDQQIWYIFLVAVPLQVSIVLLAGFK